MRTAAAGGYSECSCVQRLLAITLIIKQLVGAVESYREAVAIGE